MASEVSVSKEIPLLFKIFDPLRICMEYLSVRDVLALDSAMHKKHRSRFLELYRRLRLKSFDLWTFTSIESLEWLLQRNLRVVNLKSEIGDRSTLFHLIEDDRDDLVRFYIGSHSTEIDLNCSIDDSPAQMTALSVACKYSSKKCMAVLLDEFNVDRETVDDSGCSPIHYAASPRYWTRDDPDVMTLLLSSNPSIDINISDPHGRTATHLACSSNCPRILYVLLKNGASLSIREDICNFTTLHFSIYCMGEHKSAECLSVCIEHILSTYSDEKEIIQILNASCDDADTPLYLAVREYKDRAVSLLLQRAGKYLEISDDPNDTGAYAALALAEELYEHSASFQDKTTKCMLIDGRYVTKPVEEWQEGEGDEEVLYINDMEGIREQLKEFLAQRRERVRGEKRDGEMKRV